MGFWGFFNDIYRLIGAGLVLGALVCLSEPVYAQCTPGIPCPNSYTPGQGANDSKTGGSQACDGDFMNMIYARATLEAQREKMMTQTYLVKPDSVLEYSCFGEFANVLAENAPPIFSESEHWNNMQVELSVEGKPPADYPKQRDLKVHMDKGHITGGLEGIVMAPFRAYIGTGTSGNFPHQYLGGTAGYDPGITGTAAPSSSASCTRMQQIWSIAKCKNFEADTFKSFSEIINNDPRTNAMRACNSTGLSNVMLETARNPAPQYPTYGQLSGQYRFATFDGIRHPDPDNPGSYSDPMLLRPTASTGTQQSCAPPVRTGVMAYLELSSQDVSSSRVETVRQSFNEAICPNPDCYYVAPDGSSGAGGAAASLTGQCVMIGSGG